MEINKEHGNGFGGVDRYNQKEIITIIHQLENGQIGIVMAGYRWKSIMTH